MYHKLAQPLDRHYCAWFHRVGRNIDRDCTTADDRNAALPAAESPAPAADQAALEKAFSEMLSGATLEGSFTSTGANRDPTKLSREKYTIGQVRKIAGNLWLIPARIQYGDRDVTVPVPAPIRWAGDTPVIVVDNIPGFENMSARVMFFADHYAGYWQHGDHGGHLFGTITRADEAGRIANGHPLPNHRLQLRSSRRRAAQQVVPPARGDTR